MSQKADNTGGGSWAPFNNKDGAPTTNNAPMVQVLSGRPCCLLQGPIRQHKTQLYVYRSQEEEGSRASSCTNGKHSKRDRGSALVRQVPLMLLALPSGRQQGQGLRKGQQKEGDETEGK